MKRSLEMQTFVDDISLKFFNEKTHPDCCVTCGSKKVGSADFRDNLNIKEYSISQMCQTYQDEVFFNE